MSKTFTIKQILCGWLTFIIRDGENEYFYDVSYITNFPDDFMLALLSALGKWPADECRNRFKTDEEPRFSEWEVSAEGDDLVFHVASYESSQKKEKPQVVVIRVNRDAFLKDFLDEMNDVLHRFGLYGFRLEWTYEFPMSLFLCLKDAYAESVNPVLQKDGAENMGREYLSTDFNLEKKMM